MVNRRRPTSRDLALCCAALVLSLLPPGAAARGACEAAIAAAEPRHRIPAGWLHAIGRVEAGRPDGSIWPYAVNIAGTSHFPPDRAAAVRLVRAAQQQGTRSIDVGCLQVNLAHHPAAFDSLEQAFEPAANAAYAGQLLRELFDRHGTWTRAVAHYHSGRYPHQRRYVCLVRERLPPAVRDRPAAVAFCAHEAGVAAAAAPSRGPGQHGGQHGAEALGPRTQLALRELLARSRAYHALQAPVVLGAEE